MEPEEGRVLVKGRATIDTRPPYRSVKEAVALFGERVLVGEIYAKQLKEMEPKVAILQERSNITPTKEVISSELEETKKQLQKDREEADYIATCLKSLKEELEHTKRELIQFKAANNASIKQRKTLKPEIEELNFEDDYDVHQYEYQKKKIVTFASPPSLTRQITHDDVDVLDDGSSARVGRTSSFRKEPKEGKKRTSNPIMGWLFPRKKKNYDCEFERSPRI